jgi:hypothetical protein
LWWLTQAISEAWDLAQSSKSVDMSQPTSISRSSHIT